MGWLKTSDYFGIAIKFCCIFIHESDLNVLKFLKNPTNKNIDFTSEFYAQIFKI